MQSQGKNLSPLQRADACTGQGSVKSLGKASLSMGSELSGTGGCALKIEGMALPPSGSCSGGMVAASATCFCRATIAGPSALRFHRFS